MIFTDEYNDAKLQCTWMEVEDSLGFAFFGLRKNAIKKYGTIFLYTSIVYKRLIFRFVWTKILF